MRLLLKKNQQKRGSTNDGEPVLEKKLLSLPQWEKASSILLYAPLPEEPDLLSCLARVFHRDPTIVHENLMTATSGSNSYSSIISQRAVAQDPLTPLHGASHPPYHAQHEASEVETCFKKRFFFPYIEKNELLLYEWSSQQSWTTGLYGLQEPDPNTWSRGSIEEIDVALIPGLAFDDRGGRLGRGGGFYDRLLGNPNWRGCKIGVAWPWQVVSNVPREPHDVMMDALLVF